MVGSDHVAPEGEQPRALCSSKVFSTSTEGHQEISYQLKGLPLKYRVLYNRPQGSSKADLMVLRESAWTLTFIYIKLIIRAASGLLWNLLTHRLPLPKQGTHCPAHYK